MNRCTVCNRELSEHLGLIGTCGLLRDSKQLLQDVLQCEVLGQTKRYLTVKIPIEIWQELERETVDNARYHKTPQE